MPEASHIGQAKKHLSDLGFTHLSPQPDFKTLIRGKDANFYLLHHTVSIPLNELVITGVHSKYKQTDESRQAEIERERNAQTKINDLLGTKHKLSCFAVRIENQKVYAVIGQLVNQEHISLEKLARLVKTKPQATATQNPFDSIEKTLEEISKK